MALSRDELDLIKVMNDNNMKFVQVTAELTGEMRDMNKGMQELNSCLKNGIIKDVKKKSDRNFYTMIGLITTLVGIISYLTIMLYGTTNRYEDVLRKLNDHNYSTSTNVR